MVYNPPTHKENPSVKKGHSVDDIMASLVFLHGGDVCPLESEVAVVLEFSGARVCCEGQLEVDVSLSLTSLGDGLGVWVVRLTMPTGRIRMGRTSTGGDMGLFASLWKNPGAERATC